MVSKKTSKQKNEQVSPTGQDENKPVVAECTLCGYRMTVPNRNAPELSDYCPECGGFWMENDGQIVYYADMFTIIDE